MKDTAEVTFTAFYFNHYYYIFFLQELERILFLLEVQTCRSQQADGSFTVRFLPFPLDFIVAFQLFAICWTFIYLFFYQSADQRI